MRSSYDPTVDALYVTLSDGDVMESEEVRPGVIFDLDAEGRVLGIEMLDASTKVAPGADFTDLAA